MIFHNIFLGHVKLSLLYVYTEMYGTLELVAQLI